MKNDRLQCTETSSPIMSWVSRPVFTSAITLRTSDDEHGQDPIGYIPGALMYIHLRVHKYDMKYRGLMLYAQDATGKKVGDWDIPYRDPKMFWQPFASDISNPCQKVIFHNSADTKPFHTAFVFTAPPQGTGTIVFHTLIKTGPANTGTTTSRLYILQNSGTER
jgi:hypothetical protein